MTVGHLGPSGLETHVPEKVGASLVDANSPLHQSLTVSPREASMMKFQNVKPSLKKLSTLNSAYNEIRN